MSKQLHVIPFPQSIHTTWGDFTIHPTTRTRFLGKASPDDLAFFLDILRTSTGYPLQTIAHDDSYDPIHGIIEFDLNEKWEIPQEGYTLKVTPSGIHVSAASRSGLFYAAVSILHLLPPAVFSHKQRGRIPWSIPCLQASDQPRFPWRGAMIDSGRHFLPVPAIKRFLKQMALLKLNTLHWHLTEDQGWRIEIKRYPKLTEVGAWRKGTARGHPEVCKDIDDVPHGGFYSQEEIREIVALAESLHITVVPEIDMPGHMQAAIAAYPELGCSPDEPTEVGCMWGIYDNILYPGPETVEFMQHVLDEVIALFPSNFIHIGGDEAVKKRWDASPRVQQLRKELNLPDSHALQSWFIRQMDSFLQSKGRQLIGWDEITEGGLADHAAVMVWQNYKVAQSATSAGHPIVNVGSEPLAIHHVLPLDMSYGFDPVPSQFSPDQAKLVLGTEGLLWSEYIPNEFQLQLMAFPRLAAVAEVAWSSPSQKNYPRFLSAAHTHMARLRIMDVAHYPLPSPPS